MIDCINGALRCVIMHNFIDQRMLDYRWDDWYLKNSPSFVLMEREETLEKCWRCNNQAVVVVVMVREIAGFEKEYLEIQPWYHKIKVLALGFWLSRAYWSNEYLPDACGLMDLIPSLEAYSYDECSNCFLYLVISYYSKLLRHCRLS